MEENQEVNSEQNIKKSWGDWIYYLLILVVLIIGVIFISSLASASVSCSVSQISSSQVYGTAAPMQSLTCSNSNNNTTVNILENSDFFSLNPLSLNPNSSSTIDITFSGSSIVGNNYGNIYFNEGLSTIHTIPVFLSVNSTQLTGCQINPSIVSYSQAIQQGTKTNLPSITFSPSDCTGQLSLTSSSVSVQGGIVTPEGQKPLSITSITPQSINLQIDTSGLNTQQTYASTLNINAFNKLFTIPFNIVVTSGTNPITNMTSTNTPTCSLSATNINLNSTYNLVCTNIQPDVTIIPEVDNDYIIGTGLETSSSQYIWKFQPIQYGITNITAKFFYRSAPIGSPYKQEVKISSNGMLSPGTVLGITFTPNLSRAKAGEEVAIQLIDNRSQSLVNNPELYIDVRKVNATGNIFYYKFNSDKDYEIRGRANGYNDLLITVKLESKPMNVTITPEDIDSSSNIEIKPSESNATIYIDGTKVSSPYSGTLSEGNHTILIIKEGFFDINKTIVVKKSVSVTSATSFKKNVPQIFYLSANSSWYVMYKKDLNAQGEIILNGTGEVVQYTPKNNGIYTLYNNESKALSTNEIKGWQLYEDGKIFGFKWYYILILLVLIIIVIKLARSGSSETTTGFAPRINY